MMKTMVNEVKSLIRGTAPLTMYCKSASTQAHCCWSEVNVIKCHTFSLHFKLNAVHESEMLTDHHEEENETKSVVHIRKLLKI
ncbi:Uncharacterized protein APZ42_030907 [Daphnia magna]|uniref:Uncharacterized protein n=1 Tax=Daphnia magna TaxID=35525 RepID=A0A162DCU7_9CRUS|nr:Uncharacterized protein APZ42_030907 [Daphnia magna]